MSRDAFYVELKSFVRAYLCDEEYDKKTLKELWENGFSKEGAASEILNKFTALPYVSFRGRKEMKKDISELLENL
jgi:hypothetical protein